MSKTKIIAAQPGWKVCTPLEAEKPSEVRYDFVMKDDVIAWGVRWEVTNDANRQSCSEIVPITIHNRYHKDECYLQSPDGKITEPDGSHFENEDDFLKELNRFAKLNALKTA